MNEQVNKKSSKNILSIIIIILLIVLIVIGVMILLKEDNKNENKTDTNNNDVVEIEENYDTSLKYDLSKFDTTKSAINDNSGMAFELFDQDISNCGLTVNLNSDKKGATITIDWSKYVNIYNGGYTNSGITDTQIKNYNVNNFNGNIKKVYMKGFNSSTGSETAFYLMEDGTVEYTPIQNNLNNQTSSVSDLLKSYGKINGVSGVVEIVDATGYYPDDAQKIVGGSFVLGIKQDGTFYNLSKILNESGNY